MTQLFHEKNCSLNSYEARLLSPKGEWIEYWNDLFFETADEAFDRVKEDCEEILGFVPITIEIFDPTL